MQACDVKEILIDKASTAARIDALANEIIQDIRENLTKAQVLIVDDILDTGRTSAFSRNLMRKHGASRRLYLLCAAG